MKKVAVMSLLTVSAAFMATSEARPQDHPQMEAQPIPPYKAKADVNKTCIMNKICTLPCPYQGQVEKVSWKREDNFRVPIALYPEPAKWHQHVDYVNISSLSLQQPGEGAVLKISSVQKKHQGMHRCSVTSSTEDIDRFVYLTVHSDAASDDHSLQYLWILLPAFVIAVAFILLYRYHHKLPQVKRLCKKNTLTSHDEGPDSRDPLTSVKKTSDRLPHESFHLNGLNKETSV